MNKFCYVMVLALIFLCVHDTSCMLMLHEAYDKPGLFDAHTSCWYHQEKEYKGEINSGDIVENFVHGFEIHSLHELSQKLCKLSSLDGTRILHLLNDEQKFLVRLSCLRDDVKISIVSLLFSNNRDLAQEYCTKPIGLLLERYPGVEHAMVHYDNFLKTRPYIKLEREVFKMYCLQLTPSERSLLVNGMRYGTIHKSDVLESVNAVDKLLQASNRNHHKDLRIIAYFIRINPSLCARLKVVYLFCKRVVRTVVKKLCWKGSFMVVASCYPSIFLRVISGGLIPIHIDRREMQQLATVIRAVSRMILVCYGIFSMCDHFSYFKQEMSEVYKKERSLEELLLRNSREELRRKYGVKIFVNK